MYRLYIDYGNGYQNEKENTMEDIINRLQHKDYDKYLIINTGIAAVNFAKTYNKIIKKVTQHIIGIKIIFSQLVFLYKG